MNAESPMYKTASSMASPMLLQLHLQIRLLSTDLLIAAGQVQHPVAFFTSTVTVLTTWPVAACIDFSDLQQQKVPRWTGRHGGVTKQT
jgi:hypothetical protein